VAEIAFTVLLKSRRHEEESDMKKLFETNAEWSGTILRLGLGVAMFPHGMQKLFGWFGGYGLVGSFRFFTDQMHVPALLAFLVIIAESFGSVALITGLLTRVAALGIACDMIGAVSLVHWRNGFFMNWFGQKAGEGFEYHILAIAIALALVLTGAGNWSLDRAIASHGKKRS
jgi:putative oxidoreductase